jgi:hypothetical protein
VLLVVAAQPAGDLGVGAQPDGKLGYRGERLLGGERLGEVALGLGGGAAGQPGPAHHAGQQQRLRQRHHDDPGGHQDDHVAAGNGAPEAAVRGTASAEASDTASRKPAISVTTRAGADPAQPRLRAAVQHADQVRRGIQPGNTRADDHRGNGPGGDQPTGQGGALQAADRRLELQPH